MFALLWNKWVEYQYHVSHWGGIDGRRKREFVVIFLWFLRLRIFVWKGVEERRIRIYRSCVQKNRREKIGNDCERARVTASDWYVTTFRFVYAKDIYDNSTAPCNNENLNIYVCICVCCVCVFIPGVVKVSMNLMSLESVNSKELNFDNYIYRNENLLFCIFIYFA